MEYSSFNYNKIKKDYLKFIKKQKVLSEPFRDQIGQLNNFYLPICLKIYKSFRKKNKSTIIGLTGGQGSGKSTISKILKIILKKGFNLNTVIFSIDDFYKTRKSRDLMSKKISPLFKTRGVPGTHDTKLIFNCLKNLKKSKFKNFSIPTFDKSKDERNPKKKWQKIRKKPDIVIFEGWCVGAKPQKKRDLIVPINVLEKEKDKKGIWRKYVNNELKKNYKKIFKYIDKNIFLRVPNFKYVFKWRLLQEEKLIASSRGSRTMSKDQIKNFIMYYERITKEMLKNYDKESHIVIKIDKQHRLSSIKFN